MATDIDILLPLIPSKTKRTKVGFISQKNLAFQAAGLCNATCPTCTNEKLTGACELPAGHQGNHQCNHGHQWAPTRPDQAPGPH